MFTLRNASGAVAPVVARWFGGILLYILGAFHLIFSLWMAVEYFVGNLPNFVLPSWLTRCGFPSMCLLCNWPFDVIVIVVYFVIFFHVIVGYKYNICRWVFHLIFSLWMAVEYFVSNLPNFVLPSWLTRCGFLSMCLLCNWPLDVIVSIL